MRKSTPGATKVKIIAVDIASKSADSKGNAEGADTACLEESKTEVIGFLFVLTGWSKRSIPYN